MQVLVPLYLHCAHMPSQSELQEALINILCQAGSPTEMLLEGLQEAFPDAEWTGAELDQCKVAQTQAQTLAALLHDRAQTQFPAILVRHMNFRGPEPVDIEHILRRSGAHLDHAERERSGRYIWRFSDGSAIETTGGKHWELL